MRDFYNDSTFWTGMAVGLAAGAAGALLYAPSRGSALRDSLREGSRSRAGEWTDHGESVVTEQSEQSFPASDAPSWSPITSTGGVS